MKKFGNLLLKIFAVLLVIMIVLYVLIIYIIYHIVYMTAWFRVDKKNLSLDMFGRYLLDMLDPKNPDVNKRDTPSDRGSDKRF